MSSFLQKLKGRGAIDINKEHDAGIPTAKSHTGVTPESAPANVLQLPVDIYQTESTIVIYAPVAGVLLENLNVSIEGDKDVITIQGKRDRMNHEEIVGSDQTGKYVCEESQWGEFYRQIILPEQVDATNAEAKLKNGILVLKLPLLHVSEKKIRMKIIKLDEDSKEEGQGV